MRRTEKKLERILKDEQNIKVKLRDSKEVKNDKEYHLNILHQWLEASTVNIPESKPKLYSES
jgi:hypothetical protein